MLDPLCNSYIYSIISKCLYARLLLNGSNHVTKWL